MSAVCQEQLLRRYKIISHDYKVSKGLARACKEDIKLNHCRRGVSEDKDVRLAQILLCLEAAYKNSTKVSADCLAEIFDHRKLLMEDYQMSPEILSECADDITKFCNDLEAGGGRTIHCLMENARPKRKRDRRVTARCQRGETRIGFLPIQNIALTCLSSAHLSFRELSILWCRSCDFINKSTRIYLFCFCLPAFNEHRSTKQL